MAEKNTVGSRFSNTLDSLENTYLNTINYIDIIMILSEIRNPTYEPHYSFLLNHNDLIALMYVITL